MHTVLVVNANTVLSHIRQFFFLVVQAKIYFKYMLNISTFPIVQFSLHVGLILLRYNIYISKINSVRYMQVLTL